MVTTLGLVSAWLLQSVVANSVVRPDLDIRLGLVADEKGLTGLGDGAISKRQIIENRQIIEVVCSACQERLELFEPAICCKCIEESYICNNDKANVRRGTGPGPTCGDCVFNNCDSRCNNIGVDDEVFGSIDVRQQSEFSQNSSSCPLGRKLCCDPVDNEIFSDAASSGEDVCLDSNTIATQDFSHGVVCGKRDSRVYYNARQPKTFTNPGEWPWAVLILDQSGDYVAAGALVDNDVVVTVAHKVKQFTRNPGALKVRLGDWNPNKRDKEENLDFIEQNVDCVTLHPEQDLDNTLANNVAVLKLEKRDKISVRNVTTVSGVITLKSTELDRPGNIPEGVAGSNIINTTTSILDLRLGLVADLKGVTGLGESLERNSDFIILNYINTVCLPRSNQFTNYTERCWVASWGDKLQRQKEIDLPLLTRSECGERLRETFASKGVRNWEPQPSEVCAGGIPGEDTCRGEGGAPLVCYDDSSDQYFLAGLVGYGFACNTTLPGVYTNMADPAIQNFVTSAIGNDNFCK